MAIYLVTRKDRVCYDEYDSWVVCAKTPEKAFEMLQKEYSLLWNPYLKMENLNFKVVNTKESAIILSSFNAG